MNGIWRERARWSARIKRKAEGRATDDSRVAENGESDKRSSKGRRRGVEKAQTETAGLTQG